MVRFSKTGSCNIYHHVNETKDKTYPSDLQDMETETYNFSTSYSADTPKFTKEYIDRITSKIKSKQLVSVYELENLKMKWNIIVMLLRVGMMISLGYLTKTS